MDMKQLKNLLKNKAKFETAEPDEVGMHTCWIAYETICELEQMRDEKVRLDIVKELTGKATELRLENEKLKGIDEKYHKSRDFYANMFSRKDEKIAEMESDIKCLKELVQQLAGAQAVNDYSPSQAGDSRHETLEEFIEWREPENIATAIEYLDNVPESVNTWVKGLKGGK